MIGNLASLPIKSNFLPIVDRPLFRALYVRWRPGEEFSRECLKPTVKHERGKIMVWGCVSGAGGMGILKRVEGKVDAEVYYHILRHQMAPTMTRQGGRKSFNFMQDNAPVHTAKKINDFLERNGYDVLDDPAQSLDLSSLENIWWAIEKALLDKPLPSNGDALFFLNKFQIHLREKSISSTGSTH